MTSGPGAPAGIGFALWALPLMADTAFNKFVYGSTNLKQLRWSLVPFGKYQPDRALISAAISKVPGLIKVRP